MEANLPSRTFPYATWGPALAVGGVLLALLAGTLLAVPVAIVSPPSEGEFTGAAAAVVQLCQELGFLLVPLAIALRGGAGTVWAALSRLGFRPIDGSVVKWMAAAVGAYLVIATVYTAVFGAPKQEDIAEAFGAVPVQILLIVIAAPICEEVCFRGMLFGGLRVRMPRIAAALISGAIFGGLHAFTGVTAVPPLIGFGFVLALLYEQTGSIVPGIMLHMLNNSVALLSR